MLQYMKSAYPRARKQISSRRLGIAITSIRSMYTYVVKVTHRLSRLVRHTCTRPMYVSLEIVERDHFDENVLALDTYSLLEYGRRDVVRLTAEAEGAADRRRQNNTRQDYIAALE